MARQLRSSGRATSASWPTSMPARPRRPSASSSTPASTTRSARCTKAPRRWTGWCRSRSAASPSRRPRRPASGDDHRINIIDTPGHVDFTIEVERSLRVLDGAVALFGSVAGVEPQSETVWRQADKYGVPRIAFVNKMDRVGADFDRGVAMIRERLGANAGRRSSSRSAAEDSFRGVIDLVDDEGARLGRREPGRAATATGRDSGRASPRRAEAAREKLLEAVADADETLLEKYLEGEDDLAETRSARRSARRRSRARSSRCCAARRSRTRACSRCSTRSSTTCRRRSTCRRSRASIPNGKDATRQAADDEPFTALAFKIMTDPYVGTLTFFRVYSGTLESGAYVLQLDARAARSASAAS